VSKPLPVIDSTFPHNWQAEILTSRPLILPARQFVYPAQVEEVELGALEVSIRPAPGEPAFLATCALGFASPMVPAGVWSCPNPSWICAVAGGYAYLIDTQNPTQWDQVEFRPVTAIAPIAHKNLLVFAGFHSLVALGSDGIAWKTGRLSWEGVQITAIGEDTITGLGWHLRSDKEVEFEVNLTTGEHSGGGYLP
jgi:hypothetical protein